MSPGASKDTPACLTERGDMVESEERGNMQWEEAGATLLVLGGAGKKSKSAKAGQEDRRHWKGTGRPQQKKKCVGRAVIESTFLQD